MMYRVASLRSTRRWLLRSGSLLLMLALLPSLLYQAMPPPTPTPSAGEEIPFVLPPTPSNTPEASPPVDSGQ